MHHTCLDHGDMHYIKLTPRYFVLLLEFSYPTIHLHADVLFMALRAVTQRLLLLLAADLPRVLLQVVLLLTHYSDKDSPFFILLFPVLVVNKLPLYKRHISGILPGNTAVK